MTMTSPFRRNRVQTEAQPSLPETTLNQPEEATPKRYAVIDASLTGGDSVVIDPSAIDQLSRQQTLTKVHLSGGAFILLHHPASATHAFRSVMESLFVPELRERVEKIAAVSGYFLNPEQVAALQTVGGSVIATMRGGAKIVLPHTDFARYKAITALVFGSDAAERLKPFTPAPKPLMGRLVNEMLHPVRKRQAAEAPHEAVARHLRESEEWRESAKAKLAVGTETLPRIVSRSLGQRTQQIEDVLSRLDEMLPSIWGREGLQDDPDAQSSVGVFQRKLKELRVAHVRLMRENNDAALSEMRVLVSEAEAALSVIPCSGEDAKRLHRLIAQQLAKLSDLQPVDAPPTPEPQIDEDEAA